MKEFRLAQAIRRALRWARDNDLLQERFYFQEAVMCIGGTNISGKGVLAK